MDAARPQRGKVPRYRIGVGFSDASRGTLAVMEIDGCGLATVIGQTFLRPPCPSLARPARLIVDAGVIEPQREMEPMAGLRFVAPALRLRSVCLSPVL